MKSAQAALRLTTLVRLRISLLRIALQAAHAGGDDGLTRQYAAELAACIGAGGDLHEDAAGWLALAEVHAARHEPEVARRCLDAATTLAGRCGYHKLAFEIERAHDSLRRHTLGEPRHPWNAAPTLDRDTRAVVDALNRLPLSAEELLAL